MSVALLLLQNVYMPLECEEGGSFYSLKMVGLLRYFRKHRMQPPPRALIVPPEKYGARRGWGRCGRTLGYMPGHRLQRVGS